MKIENFIICLESKIMDRTDFYLFFIRTSDIHKEILKNIKHFERISEINHSIAKSQNKTNEENYFPEIGSYTIVKGIKKINEDNKYEILIKEYKSKYTHGIFLSHNYFHIHFKKEHENELNEILKKENLIDYLDFF